MGSAFSIAHGIDIDHFEAFVENHPVVRRLRRRLLNDNGAAPRGLYDRSAHDILAALYGFTGELTDATVKRFVQRHFVPDRSGPLTLFQERGVYTHAGLYLGRFVDAGFAKEHNVPPEKKYGMPVFIRGSLDSPSLEIVADIDAFAARKGFPNNAALFRPVINIDKPAPTDYTRSFRR